jgi:hypothetical protein
MSMWRVGETIRVLRIPSWVCKLQPDSQLLFAESVGNVFVVEDIEQACWSSSTVGLDGAKRSRSITLRSQNLWQVA